MLEMECSWGNFYFVHVLFFRSESLLDCLALCLIAWFVEQCEHVLLVCLNTWLVEWIHTEHVAADATSNLEEVDELTM